MARLGGEARGRLSAIGRRIHVRASIKEQLDQGGMTGARSDQESRCAVTTPGIQLGTSLDEGSHRVLAIGATACGHESRLSLEVPLVDFRTGLDQREDDLAFPPAARTD